MQCITNCETMMNITDLGNILEGPGSVGPGTKMNLEFATNSGKLAIRLPSAVKAWRASLAWNALALVYVIPPHPLGERRRCMDHMKYVSKGIHQHIHHNHTCCAPCPAERKFPQSIKAVGGKLAYPVNKVRSLSITCYNGYGAVLVLSLWRVDSFLNFPLLWLENLI